MAEDKKIFADLLNGEKLKDIAFKYHLSETSILNKLKTLEDNKNPNYNPKLAYEIKMARNLNSNLIDKDELDEIVKMIFDGYMLIEIAYKKDLSIEGINKILNIYNIKTSPYYNPVFYGQINKMISKTMSLDDLTLFKRLAVLEKFGVNVDSYTQIALVKRYNSFKRCYQMIDDLLNDNYETFKQLHEKHHLNTDTLAIMIREEDDIQFLNNCVDAITKQKIKLKYEQRKLELEHHKITVNNKPNEEKDKFYIVYKNINFWILFMISFKLSIYDLAEFLNVKDVKKLYNVVFERVKELDAKYINAFGYINEKVSKENVLEAKRFYQKYLLMRKVDSDKALKMLDILKDKKFHNLVASKKKIKDMTNEERLIICDYWVKYAMPIQKLPYSANDLNTYCRPLMSEQIKNIEEYNQETLKIFQRNLHRKNK